MKTFYNRSQTLNTFDSRACCGHGPPQIKQVEIQRVSFDRIGKYNNHSAGKYNYRSYKLSLRRFQSITQTSFQRPIGRNHRRCHAHIIRKHSSGLERRKGKAFSVILMDFAGAFNIVHHARLIHNMRKRALHLGSLRSTGQR